MKIRTTLYILFTVFSCVNSVSAECAWILWTLESGHGQYDTPWEVRGAYATLSACESQQKVLWNKALKEWGHCGKQINCEIDTELNAFYVTINPIHIKPNIIGEEYFRKEREAIAAGKPQKIHAFKFLCLPDTTNPQKQKP